MKKSELILPVLIIIMLNPLMAQNGDEGESAQEIAKKLANPNATLGFMSFPIDYIAYDGDLPEASSQSAFKISWQPSLPYALGERTNLFFRPLFPLIISQPVYGANGFQNEGVELGDIGFDIAIGHTFQSKWMAIVGMVGSIPTATLPSLGINQWSLGPEFFVGKTTNWGFFGALVTHSWGLSSDPNKNVSITAGQYFYTINLKNAWQIQGNPTYSYNHNATSGNRLSLPLATGLSKTIIAGKMPLKFSLQYWYYVASPEVFGPKHQIRLTITPVVPLPW